MLRLCYECGEVNILVNCVLAKRGLERAGGVGVKEIDGKGRRKGNDWQNSFAINRAKGRYNSALVFLKFFQKELP